MYGKGYNQLKKQNHLESTFAFNLNYTFLPYVTRAYHPDFSKNGFLHIIGALSRIICNKSIELPKDVKIVDNIVENEFMDYDDEKYYIKKLVSNYLGDGDNLNIFHPKLFLFLPLTEGVDTKTNDMRKAEKKLAKFLNDVLFKDIDFKGFFENYKGDSNILIQFIIENLVNLENMGYEVEYLIPKPLKFIKQTFEEDIKFVLEKNESFLIENFESIVIFYYFFYISQFSIYVNKSEKVDGVMPLYFLLDWEKAGKNRKAIKHYKKLNDYFNDLLIKMYSTEYLNVLIDRDNNEGNLIYFEIKEYVNKLENQNKQEFLKYLKLWIKDLRDAKNLGECSFDNDFESLVKLLEDTITLGIKDKDGTFTTKRHYARNAIEFVKKTFIKSRGRYGLVLNISQEFLLLITALVVKDDKMRINDLFKEYEKRGLFFDQESKKEIVNRLDNLTYIDKKSDSGDAQYVKSIL